MIKKHLYIFLSAAILISPAPANAIDFSNKNEPVEITADDAIEWQQNSKQLIARGKAEAVKGNLKLNSDTITASYTDIKGGEKKISKVTANGNVVVTSAADKAKGNFAEYNVGKNVVRIKGKPAKIIRNKGSEIIEAHDYIEYAQNKNIITAKGKVKATKNGKTVSADIIKAYMQDTKKSSNSQIKFIEAIGNVMVVNGAEKITSSKGIYNPITEIIELFGPISITQGNNTLNGGYATVNLKTGISKMLAQKPNDKDNSKTNKPTKKQRVKGVFTPTK